jgi:hypothetical protein
MRRGFRQQPIFRGDFVLRARHQRFVDQVGSRRDRAFDACDCDVEIIERADRDHARHAALRRIGIDVVEALEIGRVFDVAEQRQRVAPGRLPSGRLCTGWNARSDSEGRSDGGEGGAL